MEDSERDQDDAPATVPARPASGPREPSSSGDATVDLGPADPDGTREPTAGTTEPGHAPAALVAGTRAPGREERARLSLVASAFDPPDDRFETRGELGRGGMGRVDDAFDRALGRQVAIKHMLSHTAVDVARFEREARITARLEHPGIVPIHDAGRGADGTPFYVMRHVDGQPLDTLIANKSLADRLVLVPNLLAACDAVAFAHARNIVHRDIKPSNILVGPFGETLVIDWGLARELGGSDRDGAVIAPSDPSLTRAGAVAGTPGFMAPEQARGEVVDTRADVFALGATLFYLLAGKLPWNSSGATEMVDIVGAGRPPDWRRLPDEVAPDLRAVIVKAMAGDPEQRYADAGALAADLRRFITGNLVGAYRYGRIAKLGRFVKRHRAAVAVAGVSLIVLVIGGVLSLRRVVAERDDATRARSLAERRERETVAMADGLLVQHATALAETDPASAIATLRRLSPESSKWPEAWAAATAAWLHGIPFGFRGPPGPGILGIAGDNRHAFHIESRGGKITVFDLVERTRREIASVGLVFSTAWLGTDHIVCATRDALVIVEVSTGHTRQVASPVSHVVGNRGGRVWIRTTDRRVLELSDPAALPHEIARDVDAFESSPDLSEAVFRRGTRLELWTPARTWRLPDTRQDMRIVSVRDHVVVGYAEDALTAWRLEGEHFITMGTWALRGFISASVVRGRLFVLSGTGLSLLDRGLLRPYNQHDYAQMFATPNGFVLRDHDGRLVIHDVRGSFELQQRHVYQRVDVSLDSRFVVALTQTGDVHAWDLADVRPRVIATESGEQGHVVTERGLWTYTVPRSINRYDLSTGARTEVVTWAFSPASSMNVAMDETWLYLHDWGDAKLLIVDVAAKREFREHSATNVVTSRDGHDLAFAHADGTVWTWRAGTEPRELTRLPVEPGLLAVEGDLVVAAYQAGEIVRLDVATQSQSRATLNGAVSGLAILPDHTIWFLDDGTPWRWPPGAKTPESVEVPEPARDLLVTPRGILLSNGKWLIEIGPSGRRVIPVTSSVVYVLGDGLVGVALPGRRTGVVDLETGAQLLIPGTNLLTSTPFGAGTRIGTTVVGLAAYTVAVALWDLSVPRDPAALRRWLATITNAIPIADSDAIAWP